VHIRNRVGKPDLTRFSPTLLLEGSTPIQYLARLSKALGGVRVFVKRDDLNRLGGGGTSRAVALRMGGRILGAPKLSFRVGERVRRGMGGAILRTVTAMALGFDTRAHGAGIAADGSGTVNSVRLYQLLRQTGPIRDRTFAVQFLDPGVSAYAFKFG
jgi:tryptophan synthase beta subunit